MKEITSSANPLIKQIKRLSTSEKFRRQHGKAIIEGVHLAQSFLQVHWPVELCLVDDQWSQNPEVAQVVQQCQQQDIEVIVLPKGVFNSLSTVEHGVGLMLAIALPSSSDSTTISKNSLLLDTIQDPGNLGTMLRTAAAAGVNHVYCSAGCAAIYSPKVLRAAMGAHTVLNIYENTDLAKLISSSQVPIYATSLQTSQTIYQLDLTQPSAWIMGSEGQGVSLELLDLNIKKVIIPQEPNIESLNVAAATAICLFEQRRQILSHQS